MRRCIELVLATAGGTLVETPLDSGPADAPAPDLPPARAGGPGARGRAARHALEQHLVAIGATVVSKPDDGRIAVDVPGLAARPRARDRPDRGDRAHARIRRVPVGPPAVPGREPARCAGGGGHRRGPPRARGRGVLRGREPAHGPGPRAGQRPPAQPARRRRRLASVAGCCRAWSGWSRPTGPTGSPTCACSRSAPPSLPAPPVSGRGRSAGWPRC